MRIFNKFVESKTPPENKSDIWFDGSVFHIYKEGEWQVFTLELEAAEKIAEIIKNASNVYQEKLTAGKGITIENNVISTTNIFKFVQELPDEGEEEVIYLVPSDSVGDKNILVEYIWHSNEWEQLGEFKADIDLSVYAKKEIAASKLEVFLDGQSYYTDKSVEHFGIPRTVKYAYYRGEFYTLPEVGEQIVVGSTPNTVYITRTSSDYYDIKALHGDTYLEKSGGISFGKINPIAVELLPPKTINVKSDWNELDSSKDSFIVNKPVGYFKHTTYSTLKLSELTVGERVKILDLSGAKPNNLLIWNEGNSALIKYIKYSIAVGAEYVELPTIFDTKCKFTEEDNALYVTLLERDSASSTLSFGTGGYKVLEEQFLPSSVVKKSNLATINNKVLYEGGNITIPIYDDSELKRKVDTLTINQESQDVLIESLMDEDVIILDKIESLDKTKADTTGYYPQMSVGQADNLPDRGDVVEGLLGFRESAGAGNSIEDGTANVQELLGESLVWNQRSAGLISNSASGTTITQLSNGLYRVEVAQGTQYGGASLSNSKTAPVVGHKYAAKLELTSSIGLNLNVFGERRYLLTEGTEFICTASATAVTLLVPAATSEAQAVSFDARLLLTDLTQMFGAGNEPTTVEEFEAIKNQLVGVDFTAYNAGEVLGVNIKGIKSVNDNAWDEEWKIGYINSDGSVANGEVVISKNYIRVLPSTEYTINKTTELGGSALFCYDHNKNYIGLTENIELGDAYRVVKTLPNTCYVMFRMVKAYGNTYNHDICIRLAHSGYKTDYVAHEESESSFDLTPYFPDGMHGINGVRDSVTKSKAVRRFGVVDLGTLTWGINIIEGLEWKCFSSSTLAGVVARPIFGEKANAKSPRYSIDVSRPLTSRELPNMSMMIYHSSGHIYIRDDAYTDAASFKAAMSGVYLIYELATPIETEIDPQLNMNYKVWDFGTEELLTDSKSAPVLARTIYGFNATDTIRGNKAKIEDHEERISDLENEVVRVGDYQPDLSVGVADNLAGTEYTESEIGFRRSGGGVILDGAARVSSVKGNSVVWNQICAFLSQTITKNGLTFTVNSDNGTVVVSGTAEADTIQSFGKSSYIIKGHTYILTGCPQGGGSDTYNLFDQYFATDVGNGKMFTASYESSQRAIVIQVKSGVTLNNVVFTPRLTDLTLMFGSGNEPTTIEEFYARKPKVADENAFNEGEVIHMEADAIKSVGVNQWDEEWEVGDISSSTGANEYADNAWRSSGYLKILPNTAYYINAGGINKAIRPRFYDAAKQFVGTNDGNGNVVFSDAIFTTPANASYMRFAPFTENIAIGTSICINLSDTEVNGKYFPYVKREESLEIIKKYFPQGMKSAGTAHDEIRWNEQKQKWEAIKRTTAITYTKCLSLERVTDNGVINAYLSNDAPYTRQAICDKYQQQHTAIAETTTEGYLTSANGTLFIRLYVTSVGGSSKADVDAFLTNNPVTFVRELAEPIVTEIDENFNLDYEVWNAGTEQMIADTPSTPIKASIAYGFNAVGKIKQLEEIIAQLQTAIANLNNN